MVCARAEVAYAPGPANPVSGTALSLFPLPASPKPLSDLYEPVPFIMLVPHPRTFLSLLPLIPLCLAVPNSPDFAPGVLGEDATLVSTHASSRLSNHLRFQKRALGKGWDGKTTIAFAGTSGVGAM